MHIECAEVDQRGWLLLTITGRVLYHSFQAASSPEGRENVFEYTQPFLTTLGRRTRGWKILKVHRGISEEKRAGGKLRNAKSCGVNDS